MTAMCLITFVIACYEQNVEIKTPQLIEVTHKQAIDVKIKGRLFNGYGIKVKEYDCSGSKPVIVTKRKIINSLHCQGKPKSK